MMSLRQAFDIVLKGRSLDAAEAEAVIGEILDDVVPDALVAGFLVALRLKGESASELTGGVRAMHKRARALKLNDGNVLDTAGTGGDSGVLSGKRDLPLREAPPGSVLCRWRASRSSPTT